MPNFFISYRRSDREGQYLAHMIFRELRRRYGEESIFLDVDSRSPGLSFPMKVNRALSVTDVVLVIIGPAWLELLIERLSDSRDWVRYEVAESLKRLGLPVVPVCRAGVEMPQPHQLPEELKDLGWRDGVFLDPFQDFDRHLDRLLSDLERVFATSRREKEELRRAREKLMALLRWRARQLELAAAQEVAAKLASERAARERVLMEERAARWAAAVQASELAAQEAKASAAQRAAARAKTQEAQKKSEPNLPRVREVSASRQGPSPLPKATGRPVSAVVPQGSAPVAAPSRPVSPSPSSGATVKALALPKYYQPSKRWIRGVLSLAISGPMIFGLAIGYSYSLLGLPFVQANFILTFFYGLLSGLAAGFALKWCKALREGVAAWIGLAAGLVAVYLSWAWWFYGYMDLFREAGFLGLLDLAASPARLWHLLGDINETGSWTIWGYKPTGAVLWCLWSLEAALIAGLSTLSAASAIGVTEDVLCEDCGTWCKIQYGTAKLRGSEPAELKRRLEAKDLAFLATLGAPPSGATQWLSLNLKRCRKCGKTNTLSVSEVFLVTDSEGRLTTKYKTLVLGLLLTAAECDAIERIGREAAH